MAIGEFCRHRVRGHRQGMGLSLSDVAQSIGRTESAVRSYETGVSRPSVAILGALAKLFGVPTDDLYQKCEDPSGVEDYVGALVQHMAPLSDGEIKAAAAVLRRIGPRQRAARAGGSRGRTGSPSCDSPNPIEHPQSYSYRVSSAGPIHTAATSSGGGAA